MTLGSGPVMFAVGAALVGLPLTRTVQREVPPSIPVASAEDARSV